ncbi:MAG: phosphoglycerate kinase [Candidatus Woesearchaeota archaeon]
MDTITQEIIQKRSVAKANVKGKNIILRVDWNVPIKDGVVLDNTRVKQSLQTITYLVKKGAKKIFCVSHLGRPKGVDKNYSLKPVAEELARLVRRKVTFFPSFEESDFLQLSKREQNAKIIVLENIRFLEGEKKNARSVAQSLAAFGDMYVNDAFGTTHRAHASNAKITEFLPSYIGLLVRDELRVLQKLRDKPTRPLVSIIGFAKISDKLRIFTHLLENSDKVLLAGAVVFTFLKALGYETGKSLVEDEQVRTAKKLYAKYNDKIILPVDFVCARSLKAQTHKTYAFDEIPQTYAGFDIGEKTFDVFLPHLKDAKTIFWNGPVGLFEVKPYNLGTKNITEFLQTQKNVSIIVGGGDTAFAIQSSVSKVSDSFFLSTGGGASIASLEPKPLPAIKALYDSVSFK